MNECPQCGARLGQECVHRARRAPEPPVFDERAHLVALVHNMRLVLELPIPNPSCPSPMDVANREDWQQTLDGALARLAEMGVEVDGRDLVPSRP